MKQSVITLFSLSFFYSSAQLSSKTKTVIIVMIDGIRSQEIFKGAMQLPQHLYQKQLASTIATFLGYKFTANCCCKIH
ncbi:MAG: hypothetical protein ABI863_18825 [Ginsengibacter sp.]